MISSHDIIAFIEYEKYFQSVERADERAEAEKARAATAAPALAPAHRVLRAGRSDEVEPLNHDQLRPAA